MHSLSGITPLDTLYHDTLFRSRLEARWAVAFDGYGIEWDYEPEGYEVAPGLWYLVDFYLPQVQMYAEVKPNDYRNLVAVETEALAKMIGLMRLTGRGVLYLDGTPRDTNYWAVMPFSHDDHGDWMWVDVDFRDSVKGRYIKDERRFFMCTGEPELLHFSERDPPHEAIVAAKSARFFRRRI